MTPTDDRLSVSNPAGTGGAQDRLDGWKRIANYLNRDVRTVRRWEKSQGLPVRRLMHEKQATVYALKSEIEVWRQERDQVAPQKATATEKPGQRRHLWSLAVGLATIAAAVTWWLNRPAPSISVQDTDWVMITDFDNRSGEDALEGTLEYALQRELVNSSQVHVAPRSRIDSTLALMERSPDTAIDVATGREVSLRDGDIRVLLAGRIDRVGDAYRLGVDVLSPADGLILSSLSTEAAGQDELLSGMTKLARDVRSALGEQLPAAGTDPPLAAVTTPSLEALRLYTRADRLIRTPERDEAVTLLDDALRIDPDFASAHVLLAYVHQDRNEMVEADHHLDRAMQLADAQSEPERLFITATHQFYAQNDYPASIETYQTLVRLYPDHFWGVGNLANNLLWLGRFEEALPHFQNRTAANPGDPTWNLRTARVAGAVGYNDLRTRHMERVLAIPDLNPWHASQVRFDDVHRAWVEGDLERALAALDRETARFTPEQLLDSGLVYDHIRSLYLALGRLERFRELSALREAPGWFEALLDWDSGNPETLDTYLQQANPDLWNAALLALNGETERAIRMARSVEALENIPPPYRYRNWLNLAMGHVAIAKGRWSDAARLLGDDIYLFSISNLPEYLFATHTLARAQWEMGDTEAALQALELAARQKPMTIYDLGGTWMWLRNQVLLHEMYRQQGMEPEANRVAAELRAVLALADADHPFLRSLDD